MNITRLEQDLKSETGSDWTIGASTLLSPHDPAKGISDLLKSTSGLRKMEISLPRNPSDIDKTVKRLTELKEEHDLSYSVHAPFLYDDLAHPKETIRDIYVEEGKTAIKLAARIGASHAVFHPGRFFYRQNLPTLKLFEPFKKTRKYYLKNSLRSLAKLSDYGSSYGVNLLIENLPHGLCSKSEEINYLLSQLEGASFLLDIGHANISGSLRQLMDIEPRYFHFHDNAGEKDSHRRLGNGTIELDRLMTRLKDYKGDKTIIFELYSLEDVLSSLKVLKNP